MKTKRLLVTATMIAMLGFSTSLMSQTFQFEIVGICDDVALICGPVVDGYWVYHITYHLNKNGELTKLHWNVQQSDLRNPVTGEKYICHDTGNDELGILWDLFNNLKADMASEGIDYQQDDGWLDDYLPDVYPSVGAFVNLNFKVVGKGGVVGHWKSLVQLRIDHGGQVVARVVKDEYVCN